MRFVEANTKVTPAGANLMAGDIKCELPHVSCSIFARTWGENSIRKTQLKSECVKHFDY